MTDAPATTFANEDGLPRVPLPTLEESCARLLESCTPLLSADELTQTEAAVRAFLAPGSAAHALQAELERYERAPGVRSWLDDFWQTRYLGRRDRIALNANFFFLFEDAGQTQLERAAGLIAAAVDYKLALDAERIAPVVVRDEPQSMEQQRFLFSTTRIPGIEQDRVRAPYSEQAPGPSPARHIAVLHRGAMHRMDVLDPSGRPYAPEELTSGLRAVMRATASRSDTAPSIGPLTTKARAEWAASRQALLEHDAANADALDTVETALFCLCLEELAPSDAAQACAQLLHGDSANRWFDKAVSLIVFADGQAGINVEHCSLDGTTILHFVDTLLEADPPAPTGSGRLPALAPIEFALDDDLRADVRAAADAFAAFAAANAVRLLSFDDFGAEDAKRLRSSPDAFAQLAYQLAHKRSRGMIGATYESIATRQYQNGRTEAMRVVTPEGVAFVDAMEDPTADAASRRAAFHAAAAKHVARARECRAGAAPEQHLWALQMIQQQRGAQLGAQAPLALYESPGWLIMRDDYLSTSSAPSTHIRYFGFGSTGSRCIGVAYVLLPERFNLHLSTPLAAADQLDAFAVELRRAVGELRELLAHTD